MKEDLPQGLKFISISKGELILKLDASYGNLFKYKLEDIMEVFNSGRTLKFRLSPGFKVIEFSLRGCDNSEKTSLVTERIVSEIIDYHSPKEI